MGNRENLLAGAKRCLHEKGYARTTARDIATAAGTSLAAIGYHFGSTETLLNTALMQANEEWGEQLGQIMAADADPGATPLERFEATWRRVIESFDTYRQMWIASFEVIGQIDHLPEVREQLAAGLVQARLGLAELFQDLDPAADEKKALAVGAFYEALLTGVVSQWLIDPEHAPSSQDLTTALGIIAAGVGTEHGKAA